MERMYVLEVWMRLRVFMSVWALYGEAKAPYWKTIKRPNSSHLTLLDTKTALYKLPKNRWVIVHFEIFGPVRNKLLVTVSLDHPVVQFQNGYRNIFIGIIVIVWQGDKAWPV